MKNALLVIGGTYHPFETCAEILSATLKASNVCKTTIADRKALTRPEKYDLVIMYTGGGKLTPTQEKNLCEFIKTGGGLVAIHASNVMDEANASYLEMIGTRFVSHGPISEFTVHVKPGHQITNRVDTFRVTDEFYICEKRTKRFEVLATGLWHGEEHPMVYVRPYGKGRVCYIAMGHDERTFRQPMFQRLVGKAARWVAGEQEANPVRAGLVGYGGAFNMGRSHASQLREAGLEVTAVCDLDPDRLEVAREEQGDSVGLYTDVAEMAAAEEVDMGIIITPHNVHAANALEFLSRGKHAIVEKPFCITVEEATHMIDVARANNVMLSTYHNRRWDADFITLKHIIDSGLIGEVFHIEAYSGGYHHPGYWWRSHKPISGGAIYDWGAHFMDWILNLMPGRIESVYGFYHKRVWHDVTNEDQCQAILRFEGGRYAELQLSSIAAAGKEKWRILGTQGAIHSTWEAPIHVVSYVSGREERIDVPFLKPEPNGYYRNIAEHLLCGAPLAVTPESARRVIAVLEYAEKSAACGMPVEVPYE
ncbi:MAG: ThuA domain-containing protein [Candidatus Zipacnadales bacterium]